MNDQQDRERHLMELAEKLHFSVEKQDSRFSLRRQMEGTEPVERVGLTLDDAEDLLNRWKLRGFHGG